MTHAGIDGYSRMIVYMKCSSNNEAATVYYLFLEAIRKFSLPSRVRSDQGGENRLVALHMIRHRGHERRSMIVGSSVHNQRIERLWRDLFQSAVRLYYRLFYYLESRGYLEPANGIHIYSLHYVYLPRINKSLDQFKNAWNHHGIRTAEYKSPYQLFTAGALELQQSGLRGLDFFENVDENYGVEEMGLPSEQSSYQNVSNSSLYFHLVESDFNQLQQLVDPTQQSQNYGIDLFLLTLQFVSDCVEQNPDIYN